MTGEAIVITGATGTGKSELAVDVAERVDGEIVSADSRQVFREMDIGTAKPRGTLRGRVPHHGLDRLDPNEKYSAGMFARDAWTWIDSARERGRVPIVVGGTGFFIRALLVPLGPEPEFDPERRERLRGLLAKWPTERLKRWLGRLDPQRAAQLEGEGGPQRLARSLEVVLLSGRSHTWWLEQPPETPPLSAMVFCLQLPREDLYRRLEARFEEMMAAGLLSEVRELLDRYPEGSPGLKSVGYEELISHLRGDRTLEAAVVEAKRNTRRFARRQLTWFRHQLPETTIRLDADRTRERLAEEIVSCWKRRRAGAAESSPIASCE
jgi:tRNA dimethylallyltransferase